MNNNIDISKWEKHNVVVDALGRLWSRRRMLGAHRPILGDTQFVGGFSVRVPSSNEVMHYIFEQSFNTGAVTLFVVSEEFIELLRFPLGIMPSSPMFNWAMVNNQIMINSPSMSTPLYGLPGGGLMPALKVDSENPDTTALDIPTGYICSFGDRMPIAQGSIVYFNDPGVDPRTYVSQNTLPLSSSIYDIFQGQDGGLYMFTGDGLYVMASDALGQGQSVVGFVGLVPNTRTSRPGNACPTAFGVAYLTRNGVKVLNGPEVEFSTYHGRRSLTEGVEMEDIRQFGRLYPTDRGVVVGFGRERDYSIDVDFTSGTVTFVSVAENEDMPQQNVFGILTGRDGEILYMTASRIRCAIGTGSVEGEDEGIKVPIEAALAGRIQIGPNDSPLIRRVSVSAANIGASIATACNGKTDEGKLTSVNDDVIIGTDIWGEKNYSGGTTRSVRTTLNVRTSEPNIEIQMTGGDRRIGSQIEVQIGGVWNNRKETQK